MLRYLATKTNHRTSHHRPIFHNPLRHRQRSDGRGAGVADLRWNYTKRIRMYCDHLDDVVKRVDIAILEAEFFSLHSDAPKSERDGRKTLTYSNILVLDFLNLRGS